mmetsp:Transcript_21507/g.47840  ORF Transcript_21507/g.47840 Transcript_21507/m.47840 type:complete len:203 (-) Transcript_21507:315-923(-)
MCRATELSCRSQRKVRPDCSSILSLRMMQPPSVRPWAHRRKKSTQSRSCKCPITHWIQITSYVPGAGAKFCRPWLSKPTLLENSSAPTTDTVSPSVLYEALARYFWAAASRRGLCSTRSTVWKRGSSTLRATRPMPAPQSAAFPLARSPLQSSADSPAPPASRGSGRRSRKVWESRASMGVTCPYPPSTPSSVMGQFVSLSQ